MTSGTLYTLWDAWDSGAYHQYAVGVLGMILHRCGT